MDPWYVQLTGVVVGGVIAGSMALLAGTVNNRASHRRLVVQLAAERDRDTKRIRRERLEELFVLVSGWTVAIEVYTLGGLRLAANQLDYSQYLDLQISGKSTGSGDGDRIKMILGVYATQKINELHQECKAILDRYNSDMGTVERLARDRHVFKPSDAINFDTLRAICQELSASGRLLLAEIAREAASETMASDPALGR